MSEEEETPLYYDIEFYGIVIGCLLFIGVVWYCDCRRKKKKRCCGLCGKKTANPVVSALKGEALDQVNGYLAERVLEDLA